MIAKVILIFVFMLVTLPIWFYLLYKILVAIDASDLMWFLYWIYLPASIVINFFAKIIEKEIK